MELNYIDRKHPLLHIFKFPEGFRTYLLHGCFFWKNEKKKKVIQPKVILFFLYTLSQKQLLFISGLRAAMLPFVVEDPGFSMLPWLPASPGCAGSSWGWECLSNQHSLAMNLANLFI